MTATPTRALSDSCGMPMLEILDLLATERQKLAALEADLAAVRAAPPRWWRRRARRAFRAQAAALEAGIAASRRAADDLIDALAGGARDTIRRLMEGARARRDRHDRHDAALELEYERLEREVEALNSARPLEIEEPETP